MPLQLVLAIGRTQLWKERRKGIRGELCAVKSRGGKPPKGLGERIGGDGPSLGIGTAAKLFGQERSASDCGGAAAAEETHLSDSAGFDARGEFQDVAADGIADLNRGGGAGQFTDIARVAEVIEQGFAEHSQTVWQRQQKNCNAAENERREFNTEHAENAEFTEKERTT